MKGTNKISTGGAAGAGGGEGEEQEAGGRGQAAGEGQQEPAGQAGCRRSRENCHGKGGEAINYTTPWDF